MTQNQRHRVRTSPSTMASIEGAVRRSASRARSAVVHGGDSVQPAFRQFFPGPSFLGNVAWLRVKGLTCRRRQRQLATVIWLPGYSSPTAPRPTCLPRLRVPARYSQNSADFQAALGPVQPRHQRFGQRHPADRAERRKDAGRERAAVGRERQRNEETRQGAGRGRPGSPRPFAQRSARGRSSSRRDRRLRRRRAQARRPRRRRR